MGRKNFKVLESKLLTVTSDDGAGDLHCDTDITDSNTVPCYTHVHTRVILLSIQHLQLLSGLDHQVRPGGEGVTILEPLVCLSEVVCHTEQREIVPNKGMCVTGLSGDDRGAESCDRNT